MELRGDQSGPSEAKWSQAGLSGLRGPSGAKLGLVGYSGAKRC